MNASRPSGSQRGVFSVLSVAINAFGGDAPSAATTQMSVLRLPVATSVVVRVNATVRPSGDSCGSPTRTAASRSAIVIGRAANAGAAASRPANAASTTNRIFMAVLSPDLKVAPTGGAHLKVRFTQTA